MVLTTSPHVLFIPSWYPSTTNPIKGVFFRDQALALHKAGLKVGVVYPELRSLKTFHIDALRKQHFQFQSEVDAGISTFRRLGWSPPLSRLWKPLWVSLCLDLVRRYVSTHGKPDVIHAHGVLWGGWTAHEVAKELSVPYVITEHSSAYIRGYIRAWQEPYIGKTFAQSDAAIAVSGSLRNRLARFCPDKEIRVIGNTVDTGFFGLPPGDRNTPEVTFITIARLDRNKGIDILIRAFAQAFGHLDGTRLLIGGDGPARRSLEALALDLGLGHRVKFLGMLSRQGVRDTLWEGDAFVLPSYIETFGVTLIEAMSTGLTVIATRCGGPEDFVVPHVGMLVMPGDVNALSLALVEVAENPGRFDRHAARNYVQENFSGNAVVNKLAGIYRAVCHI